VRFFLIYLGSVILVAVLTLVLGALYVAEYCGTHIFDPVTLDQHGLCPEPFTPSSLFRTFAVWGGTAGIGYVTIANLWILVSAFNQKRFP